jgi:predicted RNA-binding Zn-ribbon protein involved in translation (DUF1610 family)
MEELEAVLETGGAAAAELAGSALIGHPCPNCGQKLAGRFCSSCGQPVDTHRRSLRHLGADLVKDLASFDSRILRTVRALLFQPGELAMVFRDGRTQRYVPPVRLYLFVSLIFFLVLSVSGIAIFQFVMTSSPMVLTIDKGKPYIVDSDGERHEMPVRYADGKQHFNISSDIVFFAREGSLHSQLTQDQRNRLLERLASAEEKEKQQNKTGVVTRTVMATTNKLVNDPAALNGALTTWIPRALFLLVPLFALLIAALYWRQRKTQFFVDHLVFSLGIHSFAFALLLVAAGCAQFLPADPVLWTAVAVLGLYLLLAMRRFYGQNWFWTGAKFAAVSFLYGTFFLLPAFGLVIVAAVMWG